MWALSALPVMLLEKYACCFFYRVLCYKYLYYPIGSQNVQTLHSTAFLIDQISISVAQIDP